MIRLRALDSSSAYPRLYIWFVMLYQCLRSGWNLSRVKRCCGIISYRVWMPLSVVEGDWRRYHKTWEIGWNRSTILLSYAIVNNNAWSICWYIRMLYADVRLAYANASTKKCVWRRTMYKVIRWVYGLSVTFSSRGVFQHVCTCVYIHMYRHPHLLRTIVGIIVNCWI